MLRRIKSYSLGALKAPSARASADVLDEYLQAEVSRWKQLTQVAVQPAAAPRPGRVAAAAAPLDPDEDTDL
jgi:hypothetical protein